MALQKQICPTSRLHVHVHNTHSLNCHKCISHTSPASTYVLLCPSPGNSRSVQTFLRLAMRISRHVCVCGEEERREEESCVCVGYCMHACVSVCACVCISSPCCREATISDKAGVESRAPALESYSTPPSSVCLEVSQSQHIPIIVVEATRCVKHH